ncbi:MAG: hypothetical protein RI973_1734, partial [Bacteroidota bacterium]
MEQITALLNGPHSQAALLLALVTLLTGLLGGWMLGSMRRGRLQRQFQQAKAAQETLSLKVQQQQEELDLRQADLVRSKRETEELRELHKMLQAEKTEVEDRLRTAAEEILQQKTAIGSYQATVEDLGNQILGLKTRNARLNSEFYFTDGNAADPVAALRGDLNDAHQQISRLEEKITRLEAGLAQQPEAPASSAALLS